MKIKIHICIHPLRKVFMELELKHIAHYFPYNLKFLNSYGNSITLSIPSMFNDYGDFCFSTYNFKPILRPLSDLDASLWIELYTANKLVEKSHWNEVVDNIKTGNTFSIPYLVFQKLLEMHFDVFGLISSGLGIDAKTIKQEKPLNE